MHFLLIVCKISGTSRHYEESKEKLTAESDKKHASFADEFVKQYDEIVHHLLVSFQSIRTRIQAVPRSDNEKDEAETEGESSLKYVIILLFNIFK